jgi:hypothetical protein
MAGKPLLGILTLYLNDQKAIEELGMYKKMSKVGQQLGLDVVVFTPDDVEERSGRIYALAYDAGKKSWQRRWTEMPHVIYDRARYQRTKRFERLVAFRRKYSHIPFLNRPLRNKWTLYQKMESSPELKDHLPDTRLYESPADVVSMLKKYPTVYFKPINGTGGRGILRIDRLSGGMLMLQGRNHSRQIVPPRKIRSKDLPAVISSWDLRGDRYIVQQGLKVKLPEGRVHDFRLLVQKNGKGEWEVTGCAGRVGPPGSITSNLHGGGRAVPMHELLLKTGHRESDIPLIRKNAESFGHEVARFLEKNYGTLCELALDLVIDENGKVWLLEVNPKPAREVFHQAGEKEVYRRAVKRPIEYALWTYRQSRIRRLALKPQQAVASALTE